MRMAFETLSSLTKSTCNGRKEFYALDHDTTIRLSGSYTLNPAKVELMYFPVFRGNERVKKIRISDVDYHRKD